ncbi:MAG TPA: AAA family ATPase [Candidatus Bipolaricaulis anaerobius]|nr:AAA family ATPase [Candidatus Bipolaricaulis anaerobius]HNS24184.1 AAA family ATPase [Candidatus Bipolaricaulis anaerobius]
MTKILGIRNFGVFRDFDWGGGLPEFKRYNVIYGWNWSGKTLLSRIFAGLQNGKPPSADKVVLELSTGEKIGLGDFAHPADGLLVRVFNRDFLQDVVYQAKGPIEPIYVFGEKAKESQQELERVRISIEEKARQKKNREDQKRQLDKKIEKLCSDGAQRVRDTLSLPGRQYEREEFRREIEAVLTGDSHSLDILDNKEKSRLKALVNAERRKKLPLVDFSFDSVFRLFQQAAEVCGRSVTAKVIEELRDEPKVNAWVEQGLRLHKELNSETCLFCGQNLPAERLNELDAHYSQAYNELIKCVDELLKQLTDTKGKIEALHLPDANLLYPDLLDQYGDRFASFTDTKDEFLKILQKLEEILGEKRSNPFRDLASQVPSISSISFNSGTIASANAVIQQHNNKVDNHDAEVDQAKERLKLDIVSEKVQEYRQLKGDLDKAEEDIRQLQDEHGRLNRGCKDLERDLLEHRRPAEELNRDLASYLGHAEITFEVEETGYRLVRNGEPAESLSEGEKTSIAFLYFLKSLTDKDFDFANGIVVIDDPISSLDSTSLYHAFGFMKTRVKDASQVFILTHNFLFFRQVKDWFRYLPRSDVEYYMLEVRKSNSGRSSRLVKLDPLLKDYESEYHYLFSLVYEAANASGSGELSQYYYLPNVIRRLLEAFLEFKVPGRESIHKRLETVDFDPSKKDRIRRFCDTHSHTRVIDELEQDPVILGEAPRVAKDVLDLMQSVDKDHFCGMKGLVDQNA